ncbi:ABC transporter ATP-binding protein [Bdellovibrio sp. GT3]|uniref:ABC transporter ATP-binding protein n=1 Tax=Bdellovibrio sp. GT3 TaxID=3136282 RepID=UPI0040400967
MQTPIISAENLNVYYGSIQALKGITFHVNKGEIVSLIGANGAGKTTTLRALSGLVPSQGTITMHGKDLMTVPSHDRVKLGMAQSPEGRGVFPQMSVLENLEMGAYHRNDKAEIKKDFEMCLELFPRIKERLWQMAGTLSGGEQQMLAISRALMCKPEILLLDEPSLGLAPLIVNQIFQIVTKLNQDGMTILLVEQNAKLALRISHRAYVLETGRVVMQDTGINLLNNDEVRKSYLGV